MAFNQKNPPWLRNAGQSIPNMQSINQSIGFSQNQGVYNQNLGMQQQQQQQQQNMSIIPQLSSIQPNQIYSQNVQYPSSRSLNTITYAQQNQQSQPAMNQGGGGGNSKFNPNARVFSGTGQVTKVQNDFGFIDEEVFFHKNVCVKGSNPKVGDRVLVEAAYNQNMPFKWNATRVQVLQSNSSGSNSSMGRNHSLNYTAVPPPLLETARREGGRNRYSPSSSRKSSERHNQRSSTRESRNRDAELEDLERRRRREEREKERNNREKGDHSSENRRDRSPARKSSPKRRKVRAIPRYMVQIPKLSLALLHADVLELKRRYTNLYVPSDYFTTNIRWVDAFPPNAPFSIQKPCAFHVMHKDVDPLVPIDVKPDPPDVDYLYTAKVMLMSTPPMSEIYHKCFASAEDKERYEDDRDFVHPTRLINFLVGIRGKNETMAIGGPWSPSLDGENPQGNPNVLVKTAIRTCKSLTGIDLSNCTHWYRFVELYYRRSETHHKGRLIPARIETVVIFLPDVRSCQPTRLEWDDLHINYKLHLDRIINNQNTVTELGSGAHADSTQSTATTAATAANSAKDEGNKKRGEAATGNSNTETAPETSAISGAAGGDDAATAAATTDDNEKGENDGEIVECEPTKAELLDPKNMKVADLKNELAARNLSTKGIKQQLTARLLKVLRQESTDLKKKDGDVEEVAGGEDENDEVANKTVVEEGINELEKLLVKDEEEFETIDNVDLSEVTVIDEYDSTKSEDKNDDIVFVKKEVIKKLDEKERQLLEKRYALPEQPNIIVHPSRTAKSGKFDCTVMSLSLLLDYRPEDTKEHSFEVSLFAELFNEMLMRDFGFNIYKSLYAMPEKKEEVKKEGEEVKKEEKKEGDDKEKEKEKEKGPEEEKNKKEEGEKEKEKETEVGKERARDVRERPRDKGDRKRPRYDEASDDDRRRNKDNKESKDNKDNKDGKDKEKDKDKERVKYTTFDPNLLLSFIYFDVSHCGYIFEKDIEELFYTLGLNLSRSQTRKLVTKAVTRDSLYYRKLTDRVKEKEPTAEDVDKESTVAVVEPETLDESVLLEIARGNTDYMEVMRVLSELVTKTEKKEDSEMPPSKKIKLEDGEKQNGVVETANGMIMHNGALLDISQLLEQMKRADKAREDTEQLLVGLRKQNADLISSNTRANTKNKDLTSDLKSLNRKLNETEQNLRDVNRKCHEYYAVLITVYDRVHPIFAKPEKRSTSITSRRGSSREKKREEKNKDKENGVEKGADKEKEKDKKKDDEPIIISDVIDVDKKEAEKKDKDEVEVVATTESDVVPVPEKAEQESEEPMEVAGK